MKHKYSNHSSTLDVSRVITSASQGLVLGPSEGEKLIRRWGHPFLIKIDELNGGSKQFAVGSEKLLPDESIHVHRHSDLEEIVIITSGKGKAFLGDKYISIEAGSLVFIPQQVWHGFDNTGTENIELLWLFPKQGMEQYFRATSVPAGEEASSFSHEELSLIRAQHQDKVEYRDNILSHYTT